MKNFVYCPIWSTPAIEIPSHDYDGKSIDSPRAGGKYTISGTAESMLKSKDVDLKRRLTTWLIEQRELGVELPEISSITINDAKNSRNISTFQRSVETLKYFSRKSKIIGTSVDFHLEINEHFQDPLTQDQKTYFELLASSESVDEIELNFLINYLDGRGFVEHQGRNNRIQSCVVTVDGYKYLAEMEETYTQSSKAFIAMWFDPEMQDARERIKEAVELAGYEPILIDEKEHINRIDDEIVSEIKRCRFLIADFTHGNCGVRGGVYYEAGFAHGFGIPVIFTCSEAKMPELHFDTRQYNHLIWKNVDELRDNLVNRITAVIGDGPLMRLNLISSK